MGMLRLKHKVTGEIVIVEDAADYLEEYDVLGKCREPKDNEIWDGFDWVLSQEAKNEESAREWNSLPKAVRSYIFHLEARLYQLNERLTKLEGN